MANQKLKIGNFLLLLLLLCTCALLVRSSLVGNSSAASKDPRSEFFQELNDAIEAVRPLGLKASVVPLPDSELISSELRLKITISQSNPAAKRWPYALVPFIAKRFPALQLKELEVRDSAGKPISPPYRDSDHFDIVAAETVRDQYQAELDAMPGEISGLVLIALPDDKIDGALGFKRLIPEPGKGKPAETRIVIFVVSEQGLSKSQESSICNRLRETKFRPCEVVDVQVKRLQFDRRVSLSPL